MFFDDKIEDLANAIIKQAVDDIVHYYDYLEKNMDSTYYKNILRQRKDSAVCFLQSEWFNILTTCDKKLIMNYIEEVTNGQQIFRNE